MDHRNEVTASVQASVKEAAIGRHWFAEARGEDRAVFEGFAALELQEEFDMTRCVARCAGLSNRAARQGFSTLTAPNMTRNMCCRSALQG